MAATASRAGVSPSSSPRLPSPPPFTEVQFGPKSPGGISASITELQLEAAAKQDDGASRRIRPGTKAVDMARGPPFVPLHQLESAFQLQEYLKTLYHKLTRDDATNAIKPVSKEMALELATPPTAIDTGETVDRNLWLYELCRFLCTKSTRMIVAFFNDTPPCSSQTCPEMRASEWQYLCAVHDPPKSCCAIDYCNHTLDWASNILTSTKHFPSRLSLGGEGTNAFQSMRQITNIFRRVYRIYAHAWFQHREVFWSIETELGLYVLFKTVCDVYQLEENYTIPPEAEGRPEDSQDVTNTSSPQRMHILQKESEPSIPQDSQANTTISTGATTRRHKHTPSTGVPVPVIAEGTEEEEEMTKRPTRKDIPMHPSPRSTGIDRVGPGRIDLPLNRDPERIPEDPTPIAQPGSSPLAESGHETKDATVLAALTTSPDALDPSDIKTSSQLEENDKEDTHDHTTASISSSPEISRMSSETSEQPVVGASVDDSDAETTIISSDTPSSSIKSDSNNQSSHEEKILESNKHSSEYQHSKKATSPLAEAKEEDNESIVKIEIPDVLVQTLSNPTTESTPSTLSQATEDIRSISAGTSKPHADSGEATSASARSAAPAKLTSANSDDHTKIEDETETTLASNPPTSTHEQGAHAHEETDTQQSHNNNITSAASAPAAATASAEVDDTKPLSSQESLSQAESASNSSPDSSVKRDADVKKEGK